MAISDILNTVPGGNDIRMIELGKIKIGGLGDTKTSRAGGTYRTPKKHDHFTITTLNRKGGARDGDLLTDEKLMEKLIAAHGDGDGKLRQIPIRVLSDDIDEILQSAFVWYGGKKVGARSDGKNVTWFYDPNSMKRYVKPVEEAWTAEHLGWRTPKGDPLFKLHSVLNCIIAATDARWGGVYKFRTTSLISFKQLYASLLHISQLTGGILRGMPLMMVLRPIQVAPDGKASTVYVVHVELRGAEMKQIQQEALAQAQWQIENKQKLMEVQAQYRKLLVAPGNESDDDAGDIATEFQPEGEIIDAAPANYSILDDAPTTPEPKREATPAPEVDDWMVGEDTTQAAENT